MLRVLDFEKPVMGHCAQFCTIRNNVSVDSTDVIVVDPELTKDTTVVEGNVVIPSDPGFVDFTGLDWELKPDSPVRKTLGGGTRFGEMGLYAGAKRITSPVKWGPDVTRPQPFNPNTGKGTWATWRPSDGDIRAFIRKVIADGVANVRVSGLKAEPFAPATDVCEALAAMESFAWDFADGSGRSFEDVKSGIIVVSIHTFVRRARIHSGGCCVLFALCGLRGGDARRHVRRHAQMREGDLSASYRACFNINNAIDVLPIIWYNSACDEG